SYVLPGAQRTYEFIWNPESFIYTDEQEVRGNETITVREGEEGFEDYAVKEYEYKTKFNFDNLGSIKFGNYQVTLQYSADTDQDFAEIQNVTQTVKFFFLPIQIILVILVPIMIMVIYAVLKRRRINGGKSSRQKDLIL